MSRLVFLHDGLEASGGGETVLLRVAAVARRSAEVDLGTLWTGIAPELGDAASGTFGQLETFGYPGAAPRAGTLLDYRAATRRLHTWLDRREPSAIVAFALRSALYSAPWARRNGVPLVWVCQQTLPLYVSRYGAAKQAILFRFLGQARPWIVALSQAGLLSIERSKPTPRRVRYIPNGVDLARFADVRMSEASQLAWRRDHGIPPGDMVAVCVARLDAHKDHPTLLRALQAAAERGVKVVVACVGACAAPGYERELHALASELGVEDQVVWAGHQVDVRPWFQMADVAVLPSLQECASLALIEAGACGLPVIGSRVGGTPEIVRDHETGLTFEPGDSAGLASALIEIADQPANRQSMGKAMRALVEDHFSQARCDAEWAAFLGELLEPAAHG